MKLAGKVIAILVALLAGFGLSQLLDRPETLVETRPETQAGLPVSAIAPPDHFEVQLCTPRETPSLLDALSPCLLLQAGGKRLIFGAPLQQNWRSIGPLDGVFLFDGHPGSSGGLNGLRYETWFSGRTSPLFLVSGELALETIQASDEASLVPDALSQVERPELDSRRAGFAVKPVPLGRTDMLVFNTGDLQVFASTDLNATGDQMIAYRVDYAGVRLELSSCEGRSLSFPGEADVLLIPTADREALTRLRDEAIRSQQAARIFEIRKIGQNCPTPSQAVDLARNRGASRLILAADGAQSLAASPEDVTVEWLGKGNVTLYAPAEEL